MKSYMWINNVHQSAEVFVCGAYMKGTEDYLSSTLGTVEASNKGNKSCVTQSIIISHR